MKHLNLLERTEEELCARPLIQKTFLNQVITFWFEYHTCSIIYDLETYIIRDIIIFSERLIYYTLKFIAWYISLHLYTSGT